MAVLSEQDRQDVWAEFMRERHEMGITKADLRVAVDAIDDWVDANQTAFNNAVPQPARGALTTKQKARLLVYVVDRRWKVL